MKISYSRLFCHFAAVGDLCQILEWVLIRVILNSGVLVCLFVHVRNHDRIGSRKVYRFNLFDSGYKNFEQQCRIRLEQIFESTFAVLGGGKR